MYWGPFALEGEPVKRRQRESMRQVHGLGWMMDQKETSRSIFPEVPLDTSVILIEIVVLV